MVRAWIDSMTSLMNFSAPKYFSRRVGRTCRRFPVVSLVAPHRDPVWRPHDQRTVVARDRHGPFESGPHRRGGKFASRLVEQALAVLISSLLHRRMTKVGRPGGRP